MILALVVTHNRLEYLKKCIKCIKSQSLKPTKLLIIDNDSKDGTKDYLKQNNISNIHAENNGSAGGWNLGVKYAIENNYKFIWMMDDDGYPNDNSLQILFNNFTTKYSSLSSLVLDSNDNKKLAIPLPILNKNKNPVIFNFKRKIRYKSELIKYGNYYDFANFFNGTLISVKSINKIGNVNKDYFIYGEEVDYFHRLRKVGKVSTCLNSFHFHPSINKSWTRIKIYYYLKNSIHLNYKYYDYPFIRSLLNIFVIFYRIIRFNKFLFFLKTFKFNNLKNIFIAIFRGFNSKIGEDYFE